MRRFLTLAALTLAVVAPAAAANASDVPPPREICIVTYASNSDSDSMPRDFCINY